MNPMTRRRHVPCSPCVVSRRLVLAFSVSLILPTVAVAAPLRVTEEFQATASRPASLVVVPARAWFVRGLEKSSQGMAEEAVAVEQAAANAVAAQLEAHGYRARVLTPADIAAQPGLTDLVVQLNEKFDEEWARLLDQPALIHAGGCNLGEPGVQVATAAGADGLVFTRVVAVGVSGGQQATAMLASLGGVYLQSYARMGVSIAQGKSGRLEAYFDGYVPTRIASLVEGPADVMGDLTRETLRRLPSAHEVVEVRRKGRKPPAAEAKATGGEKAAASDFKAALAGVVPAAAASADAVPAKD